MELMLEVKSLAFSYGNNPVFENVSFSLKKGEIMCILGPNGAGKSTLIKCIAGILKPAVGSVFIQGKDTASLGVRGIARHIGYVPQQNEVVFPFTVLDFVVMGRAPHLSMFASPGAEDIKLAKESLAMVGISDLAERPVANLSGGQGQMVLIARALVQKPALLLLDEPTSHLDFGNQVLVLETVQKLASLGMSIVMNTHMPDHAFLLGDKAAALSGGRLVAVGKVETVVTSKMMSSVYGVNVAVREIEDMKRKVCLPLRR
ncbi:MULTISPECIES: ABC transporter ATP-binding protein [Methanosarcina]|uniref:Cobalamin import ATP-binding protein BtuD n=3 Tax=Methanosarcina barkeri TaxID=2208 RepID=A0A0E3QWN0_METBA|nr:MULTISPECIES: ABC transporter ATP-binding protein [Methanosarcina]AKB56078.1 Iron(III) ABC transporter, ATP-binding protein [Methanosarcina barkeri MS]AKB59554.1 Iron(III) ABC transporter, ATP-binding protein [Methanosarcina barkeri 227]AKJ40212.1 iron ABC transporter ATP-binding protein [Methanosarcina barkeri CM1]OEC90059.1 iron ABC transporter ATP-binding protein [Methanosarcina sp. A14]